MTRQHGVRRHWLFVGQTSSRPLEMVVPDAERSGDSWRKGKSLQVHMTAPGAAIARPGNWPSIVIENTANSHTPVTRISPLSRNHAGTSARRCQRALLEGSDRKARQSASSRAVGLSSAHAIDVAPQSSEHKPLVGRAATNGGSLAFFAVAASGRCLMRYGPPLAE